MPTILDVFISSKMAELKSERDALFKLIPTLNYGGDIQLRAWVFEVDAGASGKPIRQVYLDALQSSALYLGVFWQQYGEWTIDEFDRASEWDMERHIYVKDVEAGKRDPRLTAFLAKYGDVKTGITAKWFKTTEELSASVKASIEHWIAHRLRFRAGGSSAIFAQDPDDLIEKPDKLFGRDELLTEVGGLLENKERVLLQGFGGMGKTALAATIASKWIADGKGNVLWLKTGTAEADSLFEALVRPFGSQQAIASQVGEAKLQAVRQLLRGNGALLLVLDDCWNSKALFTLLKAVPKDMAVLATARQRYPLSEIRQVDELSPSDALALLSYHAKRSFGSSDSAPELCKLLGYHAFAVEIAGKTLKVQGWTVKELVTRIKDAPEQMTMPLELSEAGRENVAKLLEVSLSALDEEAKKTFLAFGAFFAPQLTAEMLMRYSVGMPEVTDEKLRAVRAHNPQMLAEMPDNELREQYQQYLLSKTDSTLTQKVLGTLHLRGLVEGQPATDTEVIAYRIHDLAYSYVKAHNDDECHRRALQACLSYTEYYNEPSLLNFAALRPELDNLIGAASWAFEIEEYTVVEKLAWNLYVGSEFLDYGGYLNEATHVLHQAVEAARHTGEKQKEGEYLGNLGIAYSKLGYQEQAIIYFDQTRLIQIEIGDLRGQGTALGNLGLAHAHLEHEDIAIHYYEQALTMLRQIKDKQGEANQLSNLGNIYLLQGKAEKAIIYFNYALNIMRGIEDKHAEGNILGNLGNAYFALGQINRAIKYLEKSLEIQRQIGDRKSEGNQLNNLGVVYQEILKNYPMALSYYQQSRVLFSEIGVEYMVAKVDRNISDLRTIMDNTK